MSESNGLEQRVAVLESELARLKQTVGHVQKPRNWIAGLVGSFKNDPEFDEIVELGAQYRRSQTPETQG